MDPADLVAPFVSDTPFGRAIRAGMASDGLGPAFLAGYREALVALVPQPPAIRTLAATEDGPVHPRTLQTRHVDGRVWGHKRWLTGVPGAERLLVLAVAGESGDRRELVVVDVPVDAPGVRIVPLPPTRFVPEVPHAEVFLDGAAGDVLPGDGWTDFVKPFRTVEDIHVLAAVHGYLLGAAPRAGFGRDSVAALAATLAALTVLGRIPSDPAAHVALAGVFAAFRATVAGLGWSGTPEAERWIRDLPLLDVAERARAARWAAAWR